MAICSRAARGWASFALVWAGATAALADEAAYDISSLLEMDIEELFNLPVVSAARKEESSAEAAAAVYIITQEDLHRSGATSVPDALRMAPGLQVAQQDASTWAISARGFNGRFANKLLVMVDGRTVYTPLFSGVYWDVQNPPLEDIERIEIIRGPGATLWGANAVNGVINIITKRSQDTQGTLVTAGSGTEERGFGSARYGGRLGDVGAYRVYGSYHQRDEWESALGGKAADDWNQARGGFRADWAPGGLSLLTLEGDLYQGEAGSTIREPTLAPPYSAISDHRTDVAGGHLLGRWTHELAGDADLNLQLYLDRTERDSPFIREFRDTADVDFQHRRRLADRHELIGGAGGRWTADETRANSPTFQIDPADRDDVLLSAFAQDEISFRDDALRLTPGVKLEHNDYTGSEWQPGVRLAWLPDRRQTVWGSVARAVRTPSRAETDFTIDNATLPPGALGPGTPPALVRLTGNEAFAAEELTAYEAGYRVIPTDALSLDVATFYNDYASLRTLEPGAPFPGATLPPHLVLPLNAANRMDGYTYGAECAAVYRVRDGWRLEASYTYLQMELDLEAGSRDTQSEDAEGESPEHRAGVRSMLDLPRGWAFDAWLRYVDALPAMQVDSYLTLDLRLGWRVTRNVELALVGQNLLDSSHQEFEPRVLGGVASEVPRAAYVKVTLHL